MQTIKYGVSLLLILIIYSTTLSAINKLSKDNPIDCFYSDMQKVFLHLNKDIYVTGEDILFKGYLVNAANIPDTICKVVYVELQSPSNQKILGFSVNLFKGICNSYFTLPDTLTTGFYYIRAFTNQMRNFDHDYYFSAKIIVANQADDRLEKLVSDNYHNLDSARVIIYAQNDYLVEGIENKITFKISGFSEDWEKQPIEIINDSGIIVTSAIPNNKGIGDFNLTPEKNKNYAALWNKKKFVLPSQVSYGYIIQAQTDGSNVRVTILNNTHEISELLKFMAYNNGKNIFEKEFTVSNGAASFTIPVEKNRNGFTILALFNSSMELQCKKTIFIPGNSELIKISSNKAAYQPRERVKITVDLQNKELIKDSLNLLINISQKGIPGMKNIRSSIDTYIGLLSNMGAGNSEIFEPDSVSEHQINNGLLLFDFPKTISKSVCQFLPENKGCIISGHVFSKNNVPARNICVYLSVVDSFANLKYCFSDSTGRFFFRLSRYYDNKNLIFQAKGYNNESPRIEIEDKYSGESPNHIGFEYIPGNLKNYLNYSQNIVLTNKISKTRLFSNILEPQSNPSLYNRHFYGIADAIIHLSDYDDLEDFKEIVRNILPGVYYNRTDDNIRVIDQATLTLWPNEAIVILNNIPFPDPAFVAKLGSKQIKKIELKKNHIIYGDIDLYGVLSITTNQKNVYSFNPSYANISIPNIVRNAPVIISGPEYTGNNNTTKSLPDLRQTLYWNPELKLSAGGKISIEFFTSDLKGNYNVEVEGISSNGVIIYSRSSIEVK